jgi:hypothetical protein
MIIRNSKGQAFEAYQLLIAFVIATAILGIIIMMIGKTNNQAIIISDQKIEDAFLSAINSPIISMEKPFVVKDVMITGIISYDRYQNLAKIDEGCFEFMVGPGVVLENYGDVIDKKFLKTNIYFSCGIKDMDSSLISRDIYPDLFDSNPADNCEKFCVMYINKMPKALTN